MAWAPSPYPLRSTMVKKGTVRLAPTTKSRLKCRTCAVCLRLGTDHEPGGVAQEQDRDLVGVTELQEPGGLVRPVPVDGPAEVARVVGHDADGAAFDPDQGRDHARAETGSELQHRIGVGQDGDDVRDVVGPEPALGDTGAEQPLVGTRPPVVGALEVGEVLLGHRTASASSSATTSTTPLVAWTSSGPTSSGRTRRGRRPRSSPGLPSRSRSRWWR